MAVTGGQQVRVRIAPSPTGDPHVGTAYVALFNYVFARRHGGRFILRLEDTDQTRFRGASEAMILTSLKQLGLTWDEGPDVGGPLGPYRQSERQGLHRQHALDLVAKGHAYHCFCTAERLDEMRKRQREEGLHHTGYDGHCRGLSAAVVAAKLADQVPQVIRLKMPKSGITVVKDLLRGDVEFDNSRIDDQVLLKSDGFPTYHLANVVDDHLMEISHVIRAEEWISSTPKHLALYQAFGWTPPVFCHLPLLRNPDKSKISKRKNPTSLKYYERAGILPEAMLNFLGLMGYSYGDDREVFSLAEMVATFDLNRVHLGGPIFDQTKLNWLNNQYLKKMSPQRFASYVRDQVFAPETLEALAPLILERLDRLEQLVDKAGFFFNGAQNYAQVPLVPAGKTPAEVQAMAEALAERLDDLDDWRSETLHQVFDAHRGELGWKPKDYFMTIRLMTTGRKDSPPLTESLALLGREMTRFRLRDAAAFVAKQASA